MIINQCDGFSTQCNGNTTECPSLMADDEEFLMDTEEHRRLLGQQNTITYPALQKPSICSGSNCAGLYNVKKDRGCTNYCNKGNDIKKEMSGNDDGLVIIGLEAFIP
ncbi:hypothetical protein L1887_31664 [Cichorium endivia]|nr:hypothetical protein L1887_31664 [Cichorium endivia]